MHAQDAGINTGSVDNPELFVVLNALDICLELVKLLDNCAVLTIPNSQVALTVPSEEFLTD